MNDILKQDEQLVEQCERLKYNMKKTCIRLDDVQKKVTEFLNKRKSDNFNSATQLCRTIEIHIENIKNTITTSRNLINDCLDNNNKERLMVT